MISFFTSISMIIFLTFLYPTLTSFCSLPFSYDISISTSSPSALRYFVLIFSFHFIPIFKLLSFFLFRLFFFLSSISYLRSAIVYFFDTFITCLCSSSGTYIHCLCTFVTGNRVERSIGLYWSLQKPNWGWSCGRKGDILLTAITSISIY